jgi:hypothetical protein
MPPSVSAEHMDFIQTKSTDECSVAEYVEIVKDFNEQWGKNHGYSAEVAVPLQGQDLDTIFWVSRGAAGRER